MTCSAAVSSFRCYNFRFPVLADVAVGGHFSAVAEFCCFFIVFGLRVGEIEGRMPGSQLARQHGVTMCFLGAQYTCAAISTAYDALRKTLVAPGSCLRQCNNSDHGRAAKGHTRWRKPTRHIRQ